MASVARSIHVITFGLFAAFLPLVVAEDEKCPFPDELSKFKAGAPERFQRAMKLEGGAHDELMKRGNLVLRGKIGKKPAGYERGENDPPIFFSKDDKKATLRRLREEAETRKTILDALSKDRGWIGGESVVPTKVGEFISYPDLYKVFRIIDEMTVAIRPEDASLPFVIVEGVDTSKLADDQRVTFRFPGYVAGTRKEGGQTYLVLKGIPPEWLADVPMPSERDSRQIAKWKEDRQKLIDRIDKELQNLP